MDMKVHQTIQLFAFIFLATITKETNANYDAHLKTTNKPIFEFPKLNVKYDAEDDAYFYAEDSKFLDSGRAYDNGVYEEKFQDLQFRDKYVVADEQHFKEGADSDDRDGLDYGFMENEAAASDDNTERFVVNLDPVGLPFVSLDGQTLDEPIPINSGVLQSNYMEPYKDVKELENCDVEEDWIYYCGKMADGYYFDPWNPWCGFITCRYQRATRRSCRPGSWMGISNALKYNIKDMCKQRLPPGLSIRSGNVCPKTTDYQICKHRN